MFFNRKTMNMVGLAFWLALPLYLLIMPADYFDYGRALCPSKRFLNLECPGCGLTRAVQHAIHFQFEEAWNLNRGILVVLPSLIVIYVHILGRLLKKDWLPWLKKLY
jgi:hypothetical protein